MAFTVPIWVKALPDAGAEYMKGDEAGANDIINRVAKTLWEYIQSLESQQFPSGTKMVFYQAAAPIGWTQTTDDDRMLRVVSGVGGGSGGNDSPISHSHTGGDHTLIVSEMPSHTHAYARLYETGGATEMSGGTGNIAAATTGATGSDQSHNHGATSIHTPKYVDVIICLKV